MLPQAMGVFGWCVSMGGKSFLKELAGKDAGLGQAVHAFLDLDVEKAVVDKWEVVLFVDFGRYEGNEHLHILVAIERHVEVEVFEVNAHEFGMGC
jgi:hypothetical protein